MNDTVKHPSHYVEGRRFEPKDVIRDWDLNFNLGNAVKYLARAGRKDNTVEDLRRAQEYIQFEIDAIEAEKAVKEPPVDHPNCKCAVDNKDYHIKPKSEDERVVEKGIVDCDFAKRAFDLYNAFLYRLKEYDKEMKKAREKYPYKSIGVACQFTQELTLREGFDPVEVLEHMATKLVAGEE